MPWPGAAGSGVYGKDTVMPATAPTAVTALIVPPDRPAHTQTLHPSPRVLRGLVGGPLEVVVRSGWRAYLHGEGRLIGLADNPAATGLLFPDGGQVVAGTVVVFGHGPGGTDADVPAEVAAGVLAGQPRVLLGGPGELIAAVPALLGYYPADCLLALAVHAGRVGIGARVDLADLNPDQIGGLTTLLTRTPADTVIIVVVGGVPACPGRLPAQHLVTALADRLADRQVRLGRAVWVAGVRAGADWYCYHSRGRRGQLPDPTYSPLAAALAVEGVTIRASRAEFAAELAPHPSGVLAARAARLAVPAGRGDRPDAHLRLLQTAVAAAERGILPGHDEQIVALAHALQVPAVREHAIVVALGAQASAAQRLWVWLVRATPAPHRADPAALLALTAYLRGDGTLARIAAEIAEQANPAHLLAGLLIHVLDLGLRPEKLRAALRAATAPADTPPPGPQ